MPTTANFSWTIPTVGGDTDVWGTTLNACFDDIDSDLDAVKTTADAAATAITGINTAISGISTFLLSVPPVSVCDCGLPTDWTYDENFSYQTDVSLNASSLIIPLQGLRVGMRITAYQVFGYHSGGDAAATAGLYYQDTAGAQTTVSASISVAALTDPDYRVEQTGLSHDVAADRMYFIKVNPSGATGIVNIKYGSVTVVAAS